MFRVYLTKGKTMFGNRVQWQTWQMLDTWGFGMNFEIRYPLNEAGDKRATALVWECMLLTKMYQLVFFLDEVTDDFKHSG